MSQAVKKPVPVAKLQGLEPTPSHSPKPAPSTVASRKMESAPLHSSELSRIWSQLEHHDHEAHPDGAANLPQKMLLKQIAAVLEPVRSADSGQFLGLLGKCKIQGCDVHEIDCETEIIRHFKKDSALSDSWEKARSALNSLGRDVLGCEVYENDFKIIYRDEV